MNHPLSDDVYEYADMGSPSDDDVRAGLPELKAGLRALAQRVDEVENDGADSIESLAAELTEVCETLDELVAVVDELVTTAEQDPPPPQRWATRASADDWTQLIAWVDGIRLSLSLSDKYVIAPCWPAHPGVVEELAALRSAWVRAVITDAKTPKTGGSDYIAFYDRWFWPCLDRLAKTGSGYRITNCRDGHKSETARAVKPTARNLVPALGNPRSSAAID